MNNENEVVGIKRSTLLKLVEGLNPHIKCPLKLEELDLIEVDGAANQIEVLANFIMAEVDGEPSQNEGAGECAVRIIRELQAEISNLRDEAREHLG